MAWPALKCSIPRCAARPASADRLSIPTLARFAADLEWLAGQGVTVARATLSQEPEKFIACAPVHEAVQAQGEEALPAVLVDGQVRSTGRYPGRAELAGWAGITLSPPVPAGPGIASCLRRRAAAAGPAAADERC